MNGSRVVMMTLLLAAAAAVPVGAQQAGPAKTVEQWLEQLKDADAANRRQAAVALGSFGPDMSRAAVRSLGESLRDSDPTVRHAAALSLGNYGPAGKAALPAI